MEPYEVVNWKDHIIDGDGTVVQQGTLINRNTLGHMDEGILAVTEQTISHAEKLSKIDDEKETWSNKVDKSKNTLINLLPESWIGEAAPYAYTIGNDNITEFNMIDIVFPSGTTKEIIDAYNAAEICRYAQSDGKLILYADSEKPAILIPLHMIIRGDL